jgi:hypothetical protein
MYRDGWSKHKIFDFSCNLQITILICLLPDNEINGTKKRTQNNHYFLHIPFIGIWIATQPFNVHWLLHLETALTSKNSTFCAQSAIMYFFGSQKKPAIIFLHSINGLLFRTTGQACTCNATVKSVNASVVVVEKW